MHSPINLSILMCCSGQLIMPLVLVLLVPLVPVVVVVVVVVRVAAAGVAAAGAADAEPTVLGERSFDLCRCDLSECDSQAAIHPGGGREIFRSVQITSLRHLCRCGLVASLGM